MSILDTLVQASREAAERRQALIPLAALQQRSAFHAPTLSLRRALKRPDGLAFIAECKAASPSEGPIRQEYHPAQHARAYKNAAASAISVLTEESRFGGSLEHLAKVRTEVDLPLLRKDFLTIPYQIAEARAFGADAVLLIAAALDAPRLAELVDAAHRLGLGVLLEVHSEAEAEMADSAVDLATIEAVGVNHRDLKTFEVDLGLSARILPHLPVQTARVAESGVHSGADAARLRQSGADAVLVGTSLMRQPDPGAALARLRRETAIALASGVESAVASS
ncbi:MAG TPA: indole-3-glycerol-phosphate synthase [Bacteroidetes bacterium]|nr:indole-3-glycerol-phosphate synthase [Bacteroidota bacterium]